MATKKIDATSKARRDEAISLFEEYTDYVLMDAVSDGTFDIAMDTRAAAAFAQTDVEALRKLCKARRQPVDFVEPSDLKKIKPDTPIGKRHEILRNHPGTRANARVVYEAQASEATPFS